MRKRAVRSTVSNANSSRSHCIFNLMLMQRDRTEGSSIRMTKLRLVDLAGSEKFARQPRERPEDEKRRISELISINKSLTALGHCIKSIGDKNAHIPYRTSKITRILKDSIFGNSKIYVILNLSPSISNETETFSSLQFAERLKKVKLEVRNKFTNKESNVKTLRQELENERSRR